MFVGFVTNIRYGLDKYKDKRNDESKDHTSYLSRTRGRRPCKFFLAGVNFYRFNAKNWHF